MTTLPRLRIEAVRNPNINLSGPQLSPSHAEKAELQAKQEEEGVAHKWAKQLQRVEGLAGRRAASLLHQSETFCGITPEEQRRRGIKTEDFLEPDTPPSQSRRSSRASLGPDAFKTPRSHRSKSGSFGSQAAFSPVPTPPKTARPDQTGYLSKSSPRRVLPASVFDKPWNMQRAMTLLGVSLHGYKLEEWEVERIVDHVESGFAAKPTKPPSKAEAVQRDISQRLFSPPKHANRKSMRSARQAEKQAQGDQAGFGFLSGTIDATDKNWRRHFYSEEAELQEQLRATRREAAKASRELKAFREAHVLHKRDNIVARNINQVGMGYHHPDSKEYRIYMRFIEREERTRRVQEAKTAGEQDLINRTIAKLSQDRNQERDAREALELQSQRMAEWMTIVYAVYGSECFLAVVRKRRQAIQQKRNRQAAVITIQRCFRKAFGFSYTKETATISYLKSRGFGKLLRNAIRNYKLARQKQLALILQFLNDNNTIQERFKRVSHRVRVRLVRAQRLVRQTVLRDWVEIKKKLMLQWDYVEKNEYQKIKLGVTVDNGLTSVPPTTSKHKDKKKTEADKEPVPQFKNEQQCWLASAIFKATDGFPAKKPTINTTLISILKNADLEHEVETSTPASNAAREVKRMVRIGANIEELKPLKDVDILSFRLTPWSKKRERGVPWNVAAIGNVSTPFLESRGRAFLELVKVSMIDELVWRMSMYYMRASHENKTEWARYRSMMSSMSASYRKSSTDDPISSWNKLFEMYPMPEFLPQYCMEVTEEQMVLMVRWAHTEVKSRLFKDFIQET